MTLLGLVVVFFGTGCGALKAAANPKVAWAVRDPAPMSVVVRRADAAEKTSKEVDRLLTATPLNQNGSADWVQQIGPTPDAAAAEMKTVSLESFYVESRARVVPAEVWARTLPTVKGGKARSGDAGNLLGAVDKELGDKYRAISDKRQELAGLRVLIENEKTAMGGKDVTAGDKKDHEKKIADLEKMADASEKEIGPLQSELVTAARTAAGKTPAPVREKIGIALVNLRQAVEDAEIADGAAAVRYPLAAPSILSSLKAMVPVIVADIVEEQTGKRPVLTKLSPDVKLDGTSVSVTLNGLEPGDIGKLKMGELVTQTVERSTKWVVHTATLIGSIASTKDQLSFQADVLDAVLGGFSAGGWKSMVAAQIPAQDDPKVAGATAGHAGQGTAKLGTASLTSAAAGAAKSVTGKNALNDAAKNVTRSATKVANETTKAVGAGAVKAARAGRAAATKGLAEAFAP